MVAEMATMFGDVTGLQQCHHQYWKYASLCGDD